MLDSRVRQWKTNSSNKKQYLWNRTFRSVPLLEPWHCMQPSAALTKRVTPEVEEGLTRIQKDSNGLEERLCEAGFLRLMDFLGTLPTSGSSPKKPPRAWNLEEFFGTDEFKAVAEERTAECPVEFRDSSASEQRSNSYSCCEEPAGLDSPDFYRPDARHITKSGQAKGCLLGLKRELPHSGQNMRSPSPWPMSSPLRFRVRLTGPRIFTRFVLVAWPPFRESQAVPYVSEPRLQF